MHPCASQHFINSYLLFGFLTLKFRKEGRKGRSEKGKERGVLVEGKKIMFQQGTFKIL